MQKTTIWLTVQIKQLHNGNIWNKPVRMVISLFVPFPKRKKKSSLTLFFPMFLFDPSENIRKANISYPLIRSSTRAYQGVRTVRFSDAFRGDQMRILRKRRANIFITPPCNPSKETAGQINGGANSRDLRLSGRTDILWILLKVAH